MAINNRFDLIVRNVQLQAGTKKYSATSGVRMAEYVRWGNDAQQQILNRIFNCHSTSVLTKTSTIDTVAQQAEYGLPVDLHNGTNIITVLFSFDGNPINYAPLQLRTPRQEISIASYPTAYFIRNNKLVLTPVPSQGATAALKLTYQQTIPDLDIRRASITAIGAGTPVPGGTSYPLTLSVNGLLQETEQDMAASYVDYVCVVDKDGTQMATGSSFVSYNSTTHILNVLLTADEALSLASAISALTYPWLVFGKNASTHSQLPAICERYITNYCAMGVQARDSNSDIDTTNPLLSRVEEDIITAIETAEEDLSAIPILSYEYLGSEDY